MRLDQGHTSRGAPQPAHCILFISICFTSFSHYIQDPAGMHLPVAEKRAGERTGAVCMIMHNYADIHFDASVYIGGNLA